MKVCIYIDNHPRSRRIGDALLAGAIRIGWEIIVLNEFDDSPQADLIVGYGWRNRNMYDAYRTSGKHFIYIDLGYWSRKQYRSDYNGFHKCVLDARHPTRYFQRNRDNKRITFDTPVIEDWKEKGDHIVVAGMSAKGAQSMGYEPMYWERRIVQKLRTLTKRPITYRPKPSWKGFTPIEGTTLSVEEQPILDVLRGAHALVTYYSNAALDALAAGVPIYTAEGPATVLSTESLDQIEKPRRHGNRHQFFNDISYCHFTKDEIASGAMFRQFVEDGLLV